CHPDQGHRRGSPRFPALPAGQRRCRIGHHRRVAVPVAVVAGIGGARARCRPGEGMMIATLAEPMTGDDCRAEPLAEKHRDALREACAEDPDIWAIYYI